MRVSSLKTYFFNFKNYFKNFQQKLFYEIIKIKS